MHKCSKEDVALFNHGDEVINKAFNETSLFCLNRTQLMDKESGRLYGDNQLFPHRRLEIIFLPCQLEQLTDENRHLKDTKCLVDLKNDTAVQEKLKE